MYKVILAAEARNFFENAGAALQKRLDRCFDYLKADPYRHNNIAPLKGNWKGYYRYRLGDYRVIYRVDEDDRIVIVAIISHRGGAYE